MTGYGAFEKNGFRVEIRSVNHRFLDMYIRLSPLLNEHEIPIRNIVKNQFSRGKFDISITTTHEAKVKFTLNTALARDIYRGLEDLRKELSISGPIDINTLMNYRELILSEKPEYDAGSLYDVLQRALSQLEAMRRDEGKKISGDIIERIGSLERMREKIAKLCPEIIAEFKAKFPQRIQELMSGIGIDKERVFQETAFLIDRSDITEELTRIDNHLIQFRKILKDGDTIGKRLDFLLQELNREVNTIAAKASDYRISAIAIDMKSEIEKIREQVQNIQ